MTFKAKALTYRYQTWRILGMTLAELAQEVFHKKLHNAKYRPQAHQCKCALSLWGHYLFQLPQSKLLRRSPEVHSSVPSAAQLPAVKGKLRCAAGTALRRQLQACDKNPPWNNTSHRPHHFSLQGQNALHSRLYQHQWVQGAHPFLHPPEQNAVPQNTTSSLETMRQRTNQPCHLLGTLTAYCWKMCSYLADE